MEIRKLYKAGFVISSLILVAAASGMISAAKWINAGKTVPYKKVLHQFDSSGICTCIPFTTQEELQYAPKLELNKSVESFVIKYNKKNGLFLDKAKAKTESYFALIDSVLRMNNVPAELKYLAFIESGMNKNPVTRTGAIGPWALMPSAAKNYGLKIYGKNDERLNYYKSTVAAAALLTDMYAEYGDWLLAVAAYNCGPGWMRKAIKRSGSQDYWQLQNFLPKETKSHVKKFIAVHYHFEGHGSMVTMTKIEMEKHIEAVATYSAKREEQRLPDSVVTTAAK
ncbi:MAG: lytic transglycosylase domain-containing protein [Sphingobacteriales bacterium]|nr:lytic transglycosylase domain-containing protein [Sphingobacteriales bacterium]